MVRRRDAWGRIGYVDPRHGDRPLGRAGSAFALAWITALVAALVVAPAAQAQEGTGLDLIGELPLPADQAVMGQVVAVDGERQRLYYKWRSLSDPHAHITEYDTTPRIPREVRDIVLPEELNSTQSARYPEFTDLDLATQRLHFLSERTREPVLATLDLATGTTTTHSLAASLPGFQALALDHSPDDGKIYLLGEWAGDRAASSGLHLPGADYASPVPTIAAVDDASGEVAWTRPVPQCRTPLMRNNSTTSFVARGSHRAAIYFFCVQSSLSGIPLRGSSEAGVVRLNMDRPAEATQGDAAAFEVEFFPISGEFRISGSTGAVAFDPVTERLFAQSLSDANPGAWVFDGRISAWVGFVVAPPTDEGQPRYIGIDPAAGRYYIVGASGPDGPAYILTTSSRGTPVAQGTVVDTPPLFNDIATDPTSNRLFVAETADEDGHYWIFEDNLPPISPPEPIDYDAMTADVPEGQDTSVNFTGEVTGFGSQVRLVGGVEDTGAQTAVDVVNAFTSQFVQLQPAKGDRVVTTSGVPGATLTGFGATAGAQAAARDDATGTDVDNAQNELSGDEESGSEDGSGADDSSDEGSDDGDDEAAGSWPYPLVECSDGGEGASENQTDSGTDFDQSDARVVCDLAGTEVAASSSYELTDAGLGASSFDTTLDRTSDGGMTSVTQAVSSGVSLPLPGGAVLSFDRVSAGASVAAAGRTGTAAARWVRRIDGIRLTGPDGEQVYPDPAAESPPPTSCVTVVSSADGESTSMGSCQQLVDNLNRLTQTNAKFFLPEPEIQATPKGAFAGVRQSDGRAARDETVNNDGSRALPALRVEVYNDAESRSRVVADFAAIDATSTYFIQRFASFGPPQDETRFDAPGSVGDIGTEVEVPSPGLGLDGDFGEQEQQALVDELAAFLSNVNPDALAGGQQLDGPPPADGGFDDGGGDGQMAPPPTDGGFDQGLAAGPSVDVGEPPTLSQDVGGGGKPQPQVAPEAPAPQVAPPQAQDGGQQRTLESRLLSRDVGDALAVGGIWLLFLGALATALRRTSLLQLLGSR